MSNDTTQTDTSTEIFLAWSYYGAPIVEGVYATAEGAASQVNATYKQMVVDPEDAYSVGTLMTEDGTELVARYDSDKGGAWFEKKEVQP